MIINNEMTNIWQEIWGDVSSPAIFWQIAAILLSLVIAWAANGMLRAYVMRQAHVDWHLAIGGINRVLFPLTSFILILIAKAILVYSQHIGLLTLASRLLLAMAAIRLFVYALRHIFSPSGWLKALENSISFAIWGLLALYLSGVLPEITAALENITFNVSKTPVNLLQILQGALTVIITLLIALWISRLLENKLMAAQQISVNMRVVLTKVTRIILVFIAVLMALSAVGLNLTLLSVFGGALGVGLGFGLQKIASNYVSGFIILLDKSMQIGDIVTADKHYGVVADLRSRYLVLRKLDNTEVIIPNEMLITNSVINHSLHNKKTKIMLSLQISYEGDVPLAMNLLLEQTKKYSRILQDPAPSVHILGFNEAGVELNLNVWIPDPELGSVELKSNLYLDVWHAFKQHKIVLAYTKDTSASES